MNIHFIAIGQRVLFQLALALKNKGYRVSGSDENIAEPAKSRLKLRGLLPENLGWFPDKIKDRTYPYNGIN